MKALSCILVGLLALTSIPQAMALNPTLINVGDTWRVLKVPLQVSAPASGWTALEFDDTQWRMVDSEFSLENESISLQEVRAQKAPSHVFMRRSFQVADPKEIRTLRLKVEHESGFTAYLNGQVVAQVRGPGMSIVKEDLALPSEEEVYLDIADLDLSAHRFLLRPGANVLALEGEQSYPTSSPVTLAALLTANISRGPFLQSMTTTNVMIIWRTDIPLDSTVEWGATPMLGRTLNEANFTTHHAVTLSGLHPDTVYFYHVRSSDGTDSIQSPIDYLHTFKDHGPVSFVFLGDTGQNTPAQGLVARVMKDLQPDLVLHGGDVVYGGFDDKTPDTRVFGYYQKQTGQMQNTPFFFAMGNHDLNCCGGTPEYDPKSWTNTAISYQKTFFLPTNNLTGTDHFYSFDSGDVHFVACYNPWFEVYSFVKTNVQYQWLTNDLAQSTKPWKILYFHSPIAHSGQHSGADRNRNGILDQVEVMDTVGSAAVQYGAQLVICAHEHSYERFSPTNGFHTVLSGGGGAGLYGFINRHPQSAQFYPLNHCLKVDVAGETATLQAVGADGAVFDSWVINRSLPLEPVYASSWNSPVVEDAPANDNDGNINGQRFDFIGKPILGRHGKFSNPGWCYVNNDSTNLYIGFASTLLYPNQTFLLFLDSPRLPGTEEMGTIGNWVLDPDGEGADGLDTLKNIVFSGFAPSVGCILGDEFGDRTTNSFVRSGLAFNTGQGVFRLGSTITPLPGTRLQQYNRSPQTNAAPLSSAGVDKESNADFIEIAIPFRSLGGLLPGDIVKLAMVVAQGEPDPATMTRALDTTLLGSGMTPLADGRIQIAPITVRLALPPDLDSDHDGLPDDWETANGLSANSLTGFDGPDGDPDGDGYTNLQEFLAGTDPHDPNSSLKVRLNLISDARVRVEWPMLPGRSYVLEYANSDLSNYDTLLRTNLPSGTLSRRGTVVEDFSAPSAAKSRIYRVRLEP